MPENDEKELYEQGTSMPSDNPPELEVDSRYHVQKFDPEELKKSLEAEKKREKHGKMERQEGGKNLRRKFGDLQEAERQKERTVNQARRSEKEKALKKRIKSLPTELRTTENPRKSAEQRFSDIFAKPEQSEKEQQKALKEQTRKNTELNKIDKGKITTPKDWDFTQKKGHQLSEAAKKRINQDWQKGLEEPKEPKETKKPKKEQLEVKFTETNLAQASQEAAEVRKKINKARITPALPIKKGARPKLDDIFAQTTQDTDQPIQDNFSAQLSEKIAETPDPSSGQPSLEESAPPHSQAAGQKLPTRPKYDPNKLFQPKPPEPPFGPGGR